MAVEGSTLVWEDFMGDRDEKVDPSMKMSLNMYDGEGGGLHG
jgi:hypothetical protein